MGYGGNAGWSQPKFLSDVLDENGEFPKDDTLDTIMAWICFGAVALMFLCQVLS